MSERKDVTVQPATVEAVATVFTPGIMVKHHAWNTWAEVAIEHEKHARDAGVSKDLNEELKGALVAITSAAFALDALHLVGIELGIAKPVIKRNRRLWKFVAGVLPAGTVSPRAHEWHSEIRWLFDEVRNPAVHFEEAFHPPTWHDGIKSNTGVEYTIWNAGGVGRAVDLVLTVLTSWKDEPTAPTTKWAADSTALVRHLVELRH